MLPSLRSALLVASLGLGPVLLPATASANGALLPPASIPGGVPLGMRVAIAATPSGTTRWSDVTIPAGSSAGWLVPVRPGAAVDWAPGPWLDAIDDATAPRVSPPAVAAPAGCPARTTTEAPARWTSVAARQEPAPFVVQTTAASAKAWATQQGFAMSTRQSTELDALYAAGWQTVAIELAPTVVGRTSATLRVSDNGGPVVPLALAGQPMHDTKLTVFVIGAGTAGLKPLAGAAMTRDLDRKVEWGPSGSNYVSVREAFLSAESVWLRESASHDALFDGVVANYFDDATCRAEIQTLGQATGALADGAFTCGALTDLSLALRATVPAQAVVTRLVGLQVGGEAGANLNVELSAGEGRPVELRADGHRACVPRKDPPSTSDPDDDRPQGSSGLIPPYKPPPKKSGGYTSTPTTETYYAPSDGCSGGGGTVVADDYEDDDDDVVFIDDSDDDDDDDDDDSWWDTSDDSSSSDTSGWDSSDSGDDCSSSDSSSSSDDCSGDTSGGDGWDTSDSGSCSTVKKMKRRGPSPLSRLVLFAVALLLPLRRRFRPLAGDKS